MASINNNPTSNASGNAQLLGIVSSVPMPRVNAPVMANGSPVLYDPMGGRLSVGGNAEPFVVQPSVIPGSTADTNGGGIITGGGATTPGAGSQPPIFGAAGPTGTTVANGTTPAGTTPAAATPAPTGSAGPSAAATGAASVTLGGDGAAAGGGAVVMTVTGNAGTNKVQAPGAGVAANAGNGAPAATAVSVSGFGNADRGSKMVAKVGGDATFSFPSFNSTKKSNAAPDISWGAGWKRVDKGNGFHYMEHANGAKAVPAVEWRMTPSPLSAAKTVKVAHGWGKKFPDGTVLVFDKTEGPYKLAPDGTKTKLKAGTHTFGNVKVRIFEASVVRVLEKNGAVSVFDSRGNHGAGTPRSVRPDAGPSSASGGGKMVSGGGASAPVKAGGATADRAAMAAQISKITDIARGLLNEVQSGKIDTAALASLNAQLSELPDGIRQAIGGSGVVTGDAASLGLVAGGGGAATEAAAPVAGATTLAATAKLAAGESVQLDVATASAGTKRFAQLPEDLQESIAAAFGSELGTAAFEADTKFTISPSGEVKLAEGATVYKKRGAHVTGGGPGDDLAMTMKPVRQSKWASGAGSTADADARVTGGGGASAHAHGSTTTPTSAPTSLVSGGGTTRVDTATRKSLFLAGDRATIPALTSAVGGTYRWASLPVEVRQAIESYIESSTSSQAGSVWNSRTGDGWEFDPTATVVIGGGTVTFPNGIAITRSAAAAAEDDAVRASMPTEGAPAGNVPPPPGGQAGAANAAPSAQPPGHDANDTPAAAPPAPVDDHPAGTPPHTH